MPETRGKTLEEIDEVFGGPKVHHGTTAIGYAEDTDGSESGKLKMDQSTHRHIESP